MSQEFTELLRCAVRVAPRRKIPHSVHARRHTLVTPGMPMKRRRKVIKQGSGCSLSRALHCWAKLTSAHTQTHTHTFASLRSIHTQTQTGVEVYRHMDRDRELSPEELLFNHAMNNRVYFFNCLKLRKGRDLQRDKAYL